MGCRHVFWPLGAVLAALGLACGPVGPLDGGPPGGGPPVPEGFEAEEQDLAPTGPALGRWLDDALAQGLPRDAHFRAGPWLSLDEGASGELRFEVGADAVGFQLLVEAEDEEAEVVPLELIDPEGEVWVQAELDEEPSEGDVIRARTFTPQLLSPARVLPHRELGAWTFPNTPDLVFRPGWWTVRVGAFRVLPGDDGWTREAADGAVAVGLVEIPAALSERLEVVVHLARSDLDADGAREDVQLGLALDRFAEIYAPAGIEVVVTDFVDVEDPDLRTPTLEPDTCRGGGLDELLRATAGGDVRALPVVVVERFFCTVNALEIGEAIGGIAGALPGSGPVLGASGSGVVVAWGFGQGDPEKVGEVLAHEVGHSLGLFHTMERPRFDAPDLYDIIADTPDDAQSAEANLMYFATPEEVVLTPGQAEVMRSHPLVGANP